MCGASFQELVNYDVRISGFFTGCNESYTQISCRHLPGFACFLPDRRTLSAEVLLTSEAAQVVRITFYLRPMEFDPESQFRV